MQNKPIHPGRYTPAALACALALCATAAQAQVEATATLSNLSVKVIDLNTADKIKPTATWGGSLSLPYTGEEAPVTALTNSVSTALPERLYATGSIGAGSISMTTRLDNDVLAGALSLPGVYASSDQYSYGGREINPSTGLMTNYVDQVQRDYASVSLRVGQSVSSGFQSNPGEGPAVTLTLAPGTMAIVSGNLLTSVTTDSRWLRSFAQVVGMDSVPAGSWGSLTGSVLAQLDLVLESTSVVSNLTGGSTTSDQRQAMMLTANDNFNTDGVIYRDTSAIPDVLHAHSELGQSFSLAVQNWSTEDMVFVLNMQQSVDISVDGFKNNNQVTRSWDLATGTPVDVLTPPTPNIPEPGTWMLMSLGLAGITWARRRSTSANA